MFSERAKVQIKLKQTEPIDPSTTTPDFKFDMVGDEIVLLPASEKLYEKVATATNSGAYQTTTNSGQGSKRSPINKRKINKRSMSNESLSKKGSKVSQ